MKKNEKDYNIHYKIVLEDRYFTDYERAVSETVKVEHLARGIKDQANLLYNMDLEYTCPSMSELRKAEEMLNNIRDMADRAKTALDIAIKGEQEEKVRLDERKAKGFE